jgi:hypothetical protein
MDAIGITNNAPGIVAATVDHSVMAPTQKEQIRNVGFSAVYPVHVVMDLGEPIGQIATGESAAFVSFADGFGSGRRNGTSQSAHVKGFRDTTGDDPTDFGVATDS